MYQLWRLLFIHFIDFILANRILGISAFYHDSAAALVVDGRIVAAAQEERFTRIKHDASFPENAINCIFKEAFITSEDLTAVAFYDKPLLKFERLLETYHNFAPLGIRSFTKAMPVWLKEKLFLRKLIKKQLNLKRATPILFPEHHLSHAASAFYPSPFQQAAILTIDGVGEWATTTIGVGQSNQISVLRELRFPHSIGLLYSSFTYFLGFRVNSGEYKVMGLAAYGDASAKEALLFEKKILSELIDVREDGSLLLNMDYFDFATGLKMIKTKKWETLFGVSKRIPESDITQQHINLAWAIQKITDFIVVRLAATAQRLTSSKNLVMAGGVALNCVTNKKIMDAGLFENIWIQPAAGDAGGALGAAFAAYHIGYEQPRKSAVGKDNMQGAYLGPSFGRKEIEAMINKNEAVYEYFENYHKLSAEIAKKISEGNIIAWFQGRMEFGPRALGNRSILGDPRNPGLLTRININVKHREEFRPFAPSILIEEMNDYFDMDFPSPYMLFVVSIKESLRKPEPVNYKEMGWQDRLSHIRSGFPAITHVDYSARIQTVDRSDNPKFWQLLQDFKKITGSGMLINTSFNVRGEPIVCTPQQAFQTFMNTEIDFLVIDNFVLDKSKQPFKNIKSIQPAED